MKINNLMDTTDKAVNWEGRKQLLTERYASILEDIDVTDRSNLRNANVPCHLIGYVSC